MRECLVFQKSSSILAEKVVKLCRVTRTYSYIQEYLPFSMTIFMIGETLSTTNSQTGMICNSWFLPVRLTSPWANHSDFLVIVYRWISGGIKTFTADPLLRFWKLSQISTWQRLGRRFAWTLEMVLGVHPAGSGHCRHVVTDMPSGKCNAPHRKLIFHSSSCSYGIQTQSGPRAQYSPEIGILH